MSLAPIPLVPLLTAPLLLAAAASGQGSAPAPAAWTSEHRPLIVRIAPGAPIEGLAAAFGARVAESLPHRGLHLLEAPPWVSGAEYRLWARAIREQPDVLYAESDEQTEPPEIHGCGPEGEEVGAQQCTIGFIDASSSAGAPYGEPSADAMKAQDAHALAGPGIGTVVAVIDTGIDPDHSLFAGKLHAAAWDYLTETAGAVDTPNGVDDDGDGAVDEGLGHGTHIAGLVLIGHPDATLLPMRVLNDDGIGSSFVVAQAMFDAVDAGADVLNLSLSMRGECPAVAEAIQYAEYHGAHVLTSAGNTGADVLFPASYDAADWTHLDPEWKPAGTVLPGENLLAIGGVDDDQVKAPFSAWGPDVDLCTAAVDVYSAQVGEQWAWWSGTSMATGLASGAVSFLVSVWSQGGYAGTPEDLLRETGADLDAANPGYAGQLGGAVDLHAATELLLGL